MIPDLIKKLVEKFELPPPPPPPPDPWSNPPF
jgi:hypothetical protein